MKSFLEIYDFGTQTSRTVWQTPDHVEAPNWSPDGSFLVFNGSGLIYRLDLSEDAQPVRIDTGFATGCNNDHGISPDGLLLVISDKTETGKSCIYTLPIDGGTPQRVTEEVPSWWHGWSPDGSRHAYTAVRDGTFMICTCAVDGGNEIQVVGGGGHYDGPDYTPDGQWIWFNSDREGGMQLWRVRPDGSDLQKMTDDERVNWFPHPSPDGKQVLYLAYEEGTEGHPADREVELRLMPAEGGAPRTLISLFGGQGTINVPCWSPDSGSIAYVRYART
ncbi:TolB family protein [Nitratireductor basaltis]|uniref:Putative TolB-like protein n=1 Tax=Nitratireductor basaltis TaxID=472175 RepID=A0A084UD62_9HYPH|nr:TolB family protein [Nitratireductor basaltis]KFB10898.1 putative TolB-like protein [Nitratireductor basaltis]